MWSSYFVHCYYQMVPGDSILLDLSHHSGNSIDVWFDNWKQLEEPNWLQMRAPSLWTSRLCEFSNIYFHRGNALWPFLCRKLPIGKFKLQVLFSLGSFVSDKNVWNALSLLRIQLKLNTALLSTVRPCVRASVTGVTSHISHIYKGINAMLKIRDPSTPIYSESKSSWLSF